MEKKGPLEANSRVFDPHAKCRLPLGIKLRPEEHDPPSTITNSDPETQITNLMVQIPSKIPPYRWRVAEVLGNTIVIAIDAARQEDNNVAFGVWFGNQSLYNTNGWIPQDIPQNYQAAELYAVKTAIDVFRDKIHTSPDFKGINNVVIMTESAYVVDSMSQDVWKWEEKGYTTARKTPVVNSIALKELHELINGLEEKDISVKFWLVIRRHNREAKQFALDVFSGKIVRSHNTRNKSRRIKKRRAKAAREAMEADTDTDTKDNANGTTPGKCCQSNGSTMNCSMNCSCDH